MDLRADQNGRIDPAAFYQHMLAKIGRSPIAGQVPTWGPNVGITTGSPQEWARFYTMLQQQESGHRTARTNPDGSLQRFSTTIPTERSFGPGQFNVGEYGLKTWQDVNNPARVADAYINVAAAGKMPAYFGSLQRPHEIKQHAKWFDTQVAPRVGAGSSGPTTPMQMPDGDIKPSGNAFDGNMAAGRDAERTTYPGGPTAPGQYDDRFLPPVGNAFDNQKSKTPQLPTYSVSNEPEATSMWASRMRRPFQGLT